MNEPETRAELIDPKLKESGWPFLGKPYKLKGFGDRRAAVSGQYRLHLGLESSDRLFPPYRTVVCQSDPGALFPPDAPEKAPEGIHLLKNAGFPFSRLRTETPVLRRAGTGMTENTHDVCHNIFLLY